MKCHIVALPKFQLTLTPEEIRVIVDCSKLHYDAVCRQASALGGFVYGWKMCLTLLSKSSVQCSATTRELDLCCKILENPTPDDYKLARNIRWSMLNYLAEANRVLGYLRFEVADQQETAL